MTRIHFVELWLELAVGSILSSGVKRNHVMASEAFLYAVSFVRLTVMCVYAWSADFNPFPLCRYKFGIF